MTIRLLSPDQELIRNIVCVEINQNEKLYSMCLHFYDEDNASNSPWFEDLTQRTHTLMQNDTPLFSGALVSATEPDALGLRTLTFLSPSAGSPAADLSPTSGAPTSDASPTSGAPTSDASPTSGEPTADASPTAGAPTSDASPSTLKTTDEVDLTPYVFDKSLKFSDPLPPRAINVELQADWIQRNSGILDLASSISARFPQGIISSLNANLGECAPNTHKSGYTILESSFESILPPSTGVLDAYPVQTPALVIEDSPQTLPRYWFKARWKFAWEYEQKRVEKLSIQLPFCPFGKDDERIHLKVQGFEQLPRFSAHLATLHTLWPDITNDAIASLKKDLYVKYQSTAACSVPFEIGATLRLQQSVKITYANGSVSGQLREIACVCDGANKRYANLSISVAPPWLQQWRQANYALKEIVEASALEGLTDRELTETTGVTDIIIENDADVQFEKLASQHIASHQRLRELLDEHSTRIVVRMRDLKTKRHLVHLLEGQVTR
ncbi:MAG: hypothetical protein LBR89_02150 [Holosporales bacterium]|jgi:hypothetical protein|nr:hypothetical protein [Holosporales bacterium]